MGYSRADVERLLDAAQNSGNPQFRHIVALLVLTGARQREILDARWDQIDLDEATWTVPDPHTGGSRAIRLSPEAIEIIRDLPRFEGCANLVTNPKTRKPYRSITSSWETARTKAGLPYVEIDELRIGSRSLKAA